MKNACCLVAALVSISALIARPSFAAECGPTASQERLRQHVQTVLTANTRINAHSKSINEDVGRRLAGGTASQAALEEIERMNYQVSLLDDVRNQGDVILEIIFASSTLAGIRDVMFDARDKQRVSQFLSQYLSRLGPTAGRAQESVTRVLRRITSPGIAIDVAAMRDLLAKIADEYRDCQ